MGCGFRVSGFGFRLGSRNVVGAGRVEKTCSPSSSSGDHGHEMQVRGCNMKVDIRLPEKGNPRSWRKAGPPDHLDDKLDSDQLVVNKELSSRGCTSALPGHGGPRRRGAGHHISIAPRTATGKSEGGQGHGMQARGCRPQMAPLNESAVSGMQGRVSGVSPPEPSTHPRQQRHRHPHHSPRTCTVPRDDSGSSIQGLQGYLAHKKQLPSLGPP